MTLADRIGVMNGGQLAQVATPSDIYERPNSRWVADFIGDVNLIEGRVVSAALGQIIIESVAGGRLIVMHSTDTIAGASVAVALRPEKVQIDAMTSSAASDENCFAGRVMEIGYLGGVSTFKVKLDNGLDMKVTVANRRRLNEPSIKTGDLVRLSFPPEAGVVLQ
jgi:putrescine transport system ATP-binding protein